MKRRGFTLVELMMVIGVIAILSTIVVSSVSSSMKSARERRTSALCQAVQTGLATYYAQRDEWPEPLAGRVRNGNFSSSNNEGVNNQSDADLYVLQPTEVRQMVLALIDEAKKGNPLMDISALYVSRDEGKNKSKGRGLDFFTAVRGTKKSPKRMTTPEMFFGYPDKETGFFRHFKMVYSIPSDTLTVTTLGERDE